MFLIFENVSRFVLNFRTYKMILEDCGWLQKPIPVVTAAVFTPALPYRRSLYSCSSVSGICRGRCHRSLYTGSSPNDVAKSIAAAVFAPLTLAEVASARVFAIFPHPLVFADVAVAASMQLLFCLWCSQMPLPPRFMKWRSLTMGTENM